MRMTAREYIARRSEVCNCCGRSYWCGDTPDTEICATCHEPMCDDCFREWNGACCVDPPRGPSKLERSLIAVAQSLHASKQLTSRRDAQTRGKGTRSCGRM